MSSTTLIRFHCDKCGTAEDGGQYSAYYKDGADENLPKDWRRLRMTNEPKLKCGWDLCPKCSSDFRMFMEPRK